MDTHTHTHRELTQARVVVCLELVSTVAGAVIRAKRVDADLGAGGTRPGSLDRTLVYVC